MRWGILLAALALTAACSSGEAYTAGDKAKAPLGGVGAMSPGTVRSIYGQLAEIAFDSGEVSWVLLSALDPPGKVSDPPEADRCDYAEGSRVWARPAEKAKRQRGTVVKTHGKMALVLLEEGGVTAWRPCEEMKGKKAPAPPSDDPPAKETAEDGDRPCVFRPEQGRYVHCTQFTGGKCRAGTRRCKPPGGKCVFSVKEGKYVQCSSFSQGRCIAGKRPCKPSSRCVYRPDQGKHVKCGTFTQGKCKSGASACQPW